jgi:hypothetical protein
MSKNHKAKQGQAKPSWLKNNLNKLASMPAEKLDKAVGKYTEILDFHKLCQQFNGLIKIRGIPGAREDLLNGLPIDMAKQVKDNKWTYDQLITCYRNEPIFERIIIKLSISWKEIEKLAHNATGG